MAIAQQDDKNSFHFQNQSPPKTFTPTFSLCITPVYAYIHTHTHTYTHESSSTPLISPMAGLRPTSSSSLSYPLSFALRLLLLFSSLSLTLAAFAFVLQWPGWVDDVPSWWDPDMREFPGMKDLEPAGECDCCRSSGFPVYRDWKFDYQSDLKPKICITPSLSAGLGETLPWIFYHKVIGASTFFLFVEGTAASPNVTKVLKSIPGSKVIYRTKELEEQRARGRVWNETWLADFFYKLCNYELFVKQPLNIEMATVMARDAGMDWIVCLNTDELIHPAGACEYSLRQLLADVPGNVVTVIFPDYESIVERDDIIEPFTEVVIIASTATNKELHQWFHGHIVWSDKELALKLQRRGILTHIYAPIDIVQGLRESGVFSSVIKTALSTLIKDNFSASIVSSNMTRMVNPWIISKKVGDKEESQATARKVLEIEGSDISAITPQSSPGIGDIHIDLQKPLV